MKKIALVWFKSDLRLHDNETLIRAIEENDLVIPVYCFNPDDYKLNKFGYKNTGSYRAKFLIESINNLERNLKSKGSGLYILKGNPIEEIAALVNKYGARKVYAKREVTYFEKELDIQMEQVLWKQKCLFENYSTSTLYQASDLPFSIKDLPAVFTSFRKKTEKETEVRPVFETPEKINTPTIPPQIIPTLKDLGLNEVEIDIRSVFPFQGGETAALERLNYYLFENKFIQSYKETRNGLIGIDYSSKLSAWLANGSISPKYIYWKIKEFETIYGANESTYWLIFELLWRDFFRFSFKKHGDSLFKFNGITETSKPIPKTNFQLIECWKNGKIGNDFIDANMLELKHTGFMSNRGRQNVASYFIHEMNQDWRIGASCFEEQLIDYDVTNNWGNWAYLAGVGNDPRAGRQFNIEKQAVEYDKNGEYRKIWIK